MTPSPPSLGSNRMSHVIARFLREDSGQDLVEYALLTTIITAAGIAMLAAIRLKMSGAYVMWGAQLNDARFHPNNPITPYP